MSELFGRKYSLNIGGVGIEELRCSFTIKRTLSKQPNTATISVYNLAASTRRALASDADLAVELRAGYEEDNELETIFLGDVTNITSVYDAPDWVTTIESGDGINAIRRSRINRSFEPGTALRQVFKEAAECVGVDIGNALEKLDTGDVSKALSEFGGGRVISGQCFPKFADIAKSVGLDVSIQNNKLQALGANGTVSDLTVLLTPSTGLIGSPRKAEKKQWQARSLIHPGFAPGSKIKLEASEVSGFFRCEQVTYTGDNYAEPWFADLELKEISNVQITTVDPLELASLEVGAA